MDRRLRSSLTTLALAFALATALPLIAACQKPTVRFELADGAHVSDTTTVVAIAAAGAGAEVQQVAFSVDGSARYTDTSLPYSYDWDTLQETEAEHTLGATVTDSKGATASAQVRVIVDNELSKGADYHAAAALDALHNGNAGIARNRMRRALKLDPKNFIAARVKAALLSQAGDVDGAIAAFEAAAIPDSDYDARSDFWALHMAATSPDIDITSFLRHAAIAVDVYHKAAAARAATLKGDDPATAVRRGDTNLADRQWDAAVHAYEQAADVDHATGSVANRILLAYTLGGKTRAAMTLVREMKDTGRGDDVTPALEGINLLSLFRFDEARKAVKPGVAAGNLPALIAEAYADVALKDPIRGRDALRRAAEIAGDSPDVLLLQAHYVKDMEDPRDALVRAMRANPTTPEPYVAYAFLEMMRADEKRFTRAEPMLRFALKAAPDHRLATIGVALCRIGEKDAAGALALLKKMYETSPAGDVDVVYALACERQHDEAGARDAFEAAARVAPDDWGGMAAPPLPDLIARVFRYRLSPVLTPATLYTAKTAN